MPPADDDASYLLRLPRRKSFSLCRRRGEGDLLLLLKIRQKYEVFIGFNEGNILCYKDAIRCYAQKNSRKKKEICSTYVGGKGEFLWVCTTYA